ncbi:MAG: hypothetical protein ABSA65_11725 [Acidimicrobiales bacterium]|jgi:hypothetical protein
MSSLLPPVIIDFEGDAKRILATIGDVKAALADLAKGTHNVIIGGDSKPFQAVLAAVKSQIGNFSRQVHSTTIGADSKPFQTDFAAIKAELLRLVTTAQNVKLGANAKPFWQDVAMLHAEVLSMGKVSVPVDANVKAALAKIAVLRALVDETKLSMGIGLGVAGAAGLAGGAGAGGIGGLFGALGMGGGIGGLASFGTLAGVAGFGFEHLLTTLVGLIGSAIGGALGGGALALGSLGVGGVGMLTDLAGIGQASGDIHTVTADMTALNQAIAVYGKNSIEAQDATNQLKYDLSGFSQVARTAVLQAALAAEGFKSMFDKLTGPAEKTGAQIITSIIRMAEGFLPSIGKFAAENMLVIQKALGPLFTWLDSKHGGLGIFNELEEKFHKDLPIAMQAFDQGVELLVKTLGLIAPKTGGLIRDIDRLVTRLNTPAGFAKWSHDINDMIRLFHVWATFGKEVVSDIAAIFGKSAGLGSGIIQVLTTDLQQLHKAIESTAGGTSLSSLFTTHKAEVINLIQAVVQLGTAFTRTYLLIAPFCVSVVSALAKALGGLVNLINRVPGGAYVLGLTMIMGRMKLLGPLFTGATADAGLLARAFGALGKVSGLQAGFTAVRGALTALSGSMLVTKTTTAGLTVTTEELTVAQKALMTTGVLVVAAGVYELVKHFGVLRGLMISGAVAVGGLTIAMWALDSVPVVALIVAIGLGVAGLIAGIVELVKHWREVWRDIKDVAGAVWNWIKVAGPDAFGTLKNAVVRVTGDLEGAWTTVKRDTIRVWTDIVSFIASIPHRISAGLQDLGSLVAGVVGAAWRWFLRAVTSGTADVVNFVKSIPKMILKALGDLGTLLVGAGKDAVHGLARGMESVVADPVNAIKNVGKSILHGLSDAVSWMSPWGATEQAGRDAIAGLVLGLLKVNPAVTAMQDLAAKLLAIWKGQIALWQAVGVSLMQGLSAGITSAASQVAAAAVAASDKALSSAKAATKTASPSQLYAQLGADWMLGAIAGVRSEQSALTSALAAATAGALPHGAIGTGRYGSGAITMTNTYTINVRSGSNPNSVVAPLKQAFAAHDADLIRRIKAGASS